MDLDLQPVLDLQPADAGDDKLDLQPVETFIHPRPFAGESTIAGGPQLRTAGAPGAGSGLARQMMEGATESFLPPPIPPEQRMLSNVRQFMLANEVSPDASPSAPPAPRSKAEQIAAGVWQGGEDLAGGSVRFMASPVGFATAPLAGGGAAGRTLLALGFGGYMGTQAKGAAQEAGRQSVEGDLQEATRADVGMGATVLLPAWMGRQGFKEAKNLTFKRPGAPAAPPAKPETVSEFGGEAAAPPATVESAPTTKAPSLDLQPVENVAPEAKGIVKEAPGGAATSEKLDLQPVESPQPTAHSPAPVPESVDTLNHQLDLLRTGKKQAVLFTPGEEVPKWALDSEQFDTHTTPAGTFVYDAAELTKDQLDEHVKNDTIGRVLGYGIDTKPAPADTIGAVTVRDAKGVEKQSVLTDNANLASVLKAAQAMAEPTDSVRLEKPEDVITARVAAAQPGEMATDIKRQQVLENINAMAELTRQKQESEAQNAITERNIGGGGGPEHSGVPSGTDLPTHEKEIRQAAGGPAGGGGGGEHPTPVEETPAEALGIPGLPLGERPPDILDWISDNYRRGVRTTSAEDYGDYVKGATGAARDLLSNTKGERGDNVLKEMHNQGQWPRIETEDQLYRAMLDAAEARKGWLEQERTGRRAIAQLQALKLDTNGQLHAFGLLPEAWNTLLDFVSLGIRGGMKLTDAVRAAIAKFKAQFPDQPFDEAGAEQHLIDNYGVRATAERMQASALVPDEVKQAVTQYLYERRGKANAQELADGIVARMGIEAAQKLWRNRVADVPEDVRAKLIGAVLREYRRQGAGADGPTKARLTQAEAQWRDEYLQRNTELGQYISALDDAADGTPEGYVAGVKHGLDRQAQAELDRISNQTQTMQTALDTGRAEGIEAVRQDPEVNTAARAAVDQHVLDQAGQIGTPLHTGIVMELAKPWSESPVILDAAREQVRSKADEILNRQPRPPGFTPAQHLRQILDDLAGRAASIFAGHIQGAEPGMSIVDKLQQRLGLDKTHAQQLATRLSKEWDRQLDTAKKALPERLARQRAKQLAGIATPDAAASGVDKLLRQELRNQNLKLGQILKQAASDRTSTGKHIADKVVDASGLTGEKADALRIKLKTRYDELVKDAQTRRLDSLQRQAIAAAEKAGQPKPKITKPMQRAFNKLMEIDRLAPVDGKRFDEVVRSVLKLPELSAADAAELRKLVETAQAQPAGFLRQRAMVEVMKKELRLRGELRASNTAMGIFYANVLSGLTTFAKIPFENLNLFVGHTLLNYLTRPGELVHPAEFVSALAGALKRGYAKGALQGLDTLRTGTVTGVWDVPKTPGPLEMQPFGARMEPLNFWKWFTRGIGTMHETTFKPAWEVKQTMIARDVARREGLAGQQLNQRVADLLADTDAEFAKAQAQAVQELATVNNTSTLDLARRTREIIEQRREEQLTGTTGTARDYAQRVAYLNPSYGFLGAVGDVVVGSLEKLRKQFPVLGSGVKSQIPFVKVATNIINEKLNWTPIGLLRAGISHKTGKLYGRDILDPNERAEMYAKGITGTIALGGLWALRGHVHGAGPDNPQQERQLRETGWIPHSIELNGKFYGYDNTPLAFMAAVVGNAEDWSRYQKGEDDDALTRTVFALKGLSADVFSQGYLDSVGKFFEAIGDRNVGSGAGKMEKIFARTGKSFVVPNLLNQVDKLFDPTLQDQSSLQALIQAQVPFVRRLNQPALNALGEPVESAPFHTWFSQTQPDPLWLTLAQRQILVPEPSRSLLVGEKWKGPEFVRAITPDEVYQLVALSGPEIRRQLESPENFRLLATLNDADARKFVQRIAEEQRTLALQKLNLR